MISYTYKLKVEKKGVINLENLPLDAGDQIEIIIIPRSKTKQATSRYPFWGKTIIYHNPTDPIAESDWDVYK